MSEKHPKQILIIDDERAILFLLTKVIHYFLPDSKSYFAQTIKDALILLEEYDFDLIISDYKLPDGVGTQIFSHPKTRGKKIGISGHASIEFQALCDFFISKPFSIQDFSIILRS